MIEGVHHIAIICSDYERSKNFYSHILGFEIIQEVYRAERASFKLDLKISDACYIELFSFPSPPSRTSMPEACGLRHLAFSTSDLIKTMKILSAKGVVFEEVRFDESSQKRFVFFSDPDHLPIELYEK